MDSIPTLTLAPAHPARPSLAVLAAARVVDPADRDGCTWYVVEAHEPRHETPHHPHAA